ncbi:MAG: LytTR family DNA-binding domain-containing protein [Flavobacteriaceae bacterium]|nr:LytTR family DNA-binding domain-containing protein [Flavobacteriaceae bacterium]
MNIKCLIIDDEPLAIKVIKNHLKEFKNFEIVASFSNPIDAMATLKKQQIDAVFLDINMSKMDGLSFVRSVDLKPIIVITTAYREFAIESYELNILDYLVKPIPFSRFLKSINKITQQIYLQRDKNKRNITNTDSHIFLKADRKLIKVNFNDIYYIESLKDYIMVFTAIGDYLTHRSLTSFTEELPKNNFLRIHRSYTIAINKVKSIEGNLIEVSSKKIPIGRKYVSQVKQIILKKSMKD